jgi:hypothetical protein
MVYFIPGARASVAELLKGVERTLANFKTPKPHNVFITDKPLPRGATGKILKEQVRKDVASLRASKSKL